MAGLVAAGCEKRSEPEPKPVATTAQPLAKAKLAEPKDATTHYAMPAPERLVAIGDLHGDLEAAKLALRAAGAIDAKDAWSGGKLVLVQTGDQVDRGDDDRAILDLFERLKGEAKAAGGQVLALAGNHELMNAQGDFRYVTPGGFAAFDEAHVGEAQKARASAFAPGGVYAKRIAERPVVVKVGDTVFAHGGVLPKHVTFGLDRINDKVRAWLLGQEPAPPPQAVGEDGVTWTRAYSAAPGREECEMLYETLGALGAKRLVMGHTVQRGGISKACDDKAVRIDVGMARVYQGPIEVLEIKGDVVTVVKGPARP